MSERIRTILCITGLLCALGVSPVAAETVSPAAMLSQGNHGFRSTAQVDTVQSVNGMLRKRCMTLVASASRWVADHLVFEVHRDEHRRDGDPVVFTARERPDVVSTAAWARPQSARSPWRLAVSGSRKHARLMVKVRW